MKARKEETRGKMADKNIFQEGRKERRKEGRKEGREGRKID